MHYAERVRSESDKLDFTSNGKAFSISLSAGIAVRDDNESFYTTLQRADENLYKAKEGGRNRVVF